MNLLNDVIQYLNATCYNAACYNAAKF